MIVRNWHVNGSLPHPRSGSVEIRSHDEMWIASVLGSHHAPGERDAGGFPSDIEANENAARIVQCVNACEGLSDPAETRNDVIRLLKDLQGSLSTFSHDNIVAACTVMLDKLGEPSEPNTE